MQKEKVLILNCHSERVSLLSDILQAQGYEVLVLCNKTDEDIQHEIHSYHPDYVVMDDDELIALTTH